MRVPDRLLELFVFVMCSAGLAAGNRTRRQTSLLCLGDDFITTLVNGVLDANRETLRRNEPNPLGTCQEYGVFKICNGRARGLYGLAFPSGISALCDDTGDYVRFKATMTVQDFFFDFDINYPLSYGGGTLTAAWQLFAADITAYWPLRKAETGEAPKITNMAITVQRQPYVKITGFYPVSIAFRIFFEGSVRIFPQFSNSFLSYLLREVLQQWIDGYHTKLPF